MRYLPTEKFQQGTSDLTEYVPPGFHFLKGHVTGEKGILYFGATSCIFVPLSTVPNRQFNTG